MTSPASLTFWLGVLTILAELALYAALAALCVWVWVMVIREVRRLKKRK